MIGGGEDFTTTQLAVAVHCLLHCLSIYNIIHNHNGIYMVVAFYFLSSLRKEPGFFFFVCVCVVVCGLFHHLSTRPVD